MGVWNERYVVGVIVFNMVPKDDGTDERLAVRWCAPWKANHGLHPFTERFDNLDDAREYAESFTEGNARWTLAHGNGKDHEHCAVEVIKVEGWHATPVTCHEWLWGKVHQEWHNEECAALLSSAPRLKPWA